MKSANRKVPESWFNSDTGYILMTASISLMKKHFSGLTVIKPMADTSYRVVFITETGIKIFDLGFQPGKQARVYFMLEPLQKKTVVKTLERDFSLMLETVPVCKTPVRMQVKSGTQQVLRFKTHPGKALYFFSDGDRKPVKAFQRSGLWNATRIEFFSRDGHKVDSVKMSQSPLRLRMEFKRINEIQDNDER